MEQIRSTTHVLDSLWQSPYQHRMAWPKLMTSVHLLAINTADKDVLPSLDSTHWIQYCWQIGYSIAAHPIGSYALLSIPLNIIRINAHFASRALLRWLLILTPHPSPSLVYLQGSISPIITHGRALVFLGLSSTHQAVVRGWMYSNPSREPSAAVRL